MKPPPTRRSEIRYLFPDPLIGSPHSGQRPLLACTLYPHFTQNRLASILRFSSSFSLPSFMIHITSAPITITGTTHMQIVSRSMV